MHVLLFSPFSYFEPHSLPELVLADSLNFEGAKVTVINCDGIFEEFCLTMPIEIFSNTEEKQKICSKCKRNRNAYRREFDFDFQNIEDYIFSSDKEHIHEILSTINSQNYLNLVFDGIPIGRYSIYEFMLNHKLNTAAIPEELWPQLRNQLENSILAAITAKRFLNKTQPEVVIFYNSLYSVNRVVAAVAENLGIRHYMVHAGAHLRYRVNQLLITEGFSFYYNKSPEVAKFRNSFMNQTEIAYVNEHVFELFQATSPWVYSAQGGKRESTNLKLELGIGNSQKVALAVMRSNDERLAATYAGVDGLQGSPIFRSQIDWLNWLTDFCWKNPSLFVIFRIHPREFPNKRESVLSQAASEMLKLIENYQFPPNFHLNLPSDDYSLHDLLKITNLMLNNSSSAGLEGNLFGIPVLGIADTLYSFDEYLQIEPRDIQEYERLILELVHYQHDFDRVIKSYRWLNFVLSEVSIDISDGYKTRIEKHRKFLIFLARGLRKIGLPYPDNAVTGRVQTRRIPLKEHDRLVYAILNRTQSHVGKISREFTGDAREEFVEISNHMLEIYSRISGNSDVNFLDQMRGMMERYQETIS